MAVKTITIDMFAYTLLARTKKEGQSFSDVIKAHFNRPPTVAEFRKVCRTVRLSESTLDAVEEQIRARPDSPMRYPEL